MSRSPTASAWLRLIAALLPLALAACASAPKKSASEAMAAPDHDKVHGTPLPHGRKKSPYAPAQEDPRTRGDYVAGGLYKPGMSDSTPDFIPDVDAIPEPEVVAEPRSKIGNRPSYSVLGKTYRVLGDHSGYVERGTASYYGQKFHGRRTSNLEVYDMYAFTAAHKTLPLPSFARVTNLDNGKSVIVRVNDRGPFHDGRLIDLSYAAAIKLGITQRGTGRVEVRALDPGDEDGGAKTVAASAPPPKDALKEAPKAAAAPSAMDKLVAAMPIASARAGELPPGVRIATGKPTRLNAAAATTETDKPVPAPAGVDGNSVAQAATPSVAPLSAATGAAVVSTTPSGGDVTFQVASFSSRDKADRALSVLRGAGIDTARVSDGSANGQKVWRLRVGPLQAARATELAARIAGLGFGQPQRVRD